MQKLLSTLLTIIFFQTSIFAFPVSFVVFNNYNSNSLTATKTLLNLPNNIKETYYATVNASNVENLQQIGYSIGDRVYDYKENPMLFVKDSARIITSYDMYEAGFNNDNMFYATGLILGGLALDIAGAPIKAGKGIVKTAKVTEKVANVGKELNTNKILATTIDNKIRMMANPNLDEKIFYITKGYLPNVTGGEFVYLNKLSYYAGIEALSMGKEVRIIGAFPDYLNLSEALGTKVFNLPPKVWKNTSMKEINKANFKFITRGADKNATFILSNPERMPNQYGIGLKNEIKWLENLGYKISNDGVKYTK